MTDLIANGDFAGGGVNVTPSDTVDLANGPWAIQCTATGAIKVHTRDGDTVVYNVPTAGAILPFVVTRVFATGTTVPSADIVAVRYR